MSEQNQSKNSSSGSTTISGGVAPASGLTAADFRSLFHEVELEESAVGPLETIRNDSSCPDFSEASLKSEESFQQHLQGWLSSIGLEHAHISVRTLGSKKRRTSRGSASSIGSDSSSEQSKSEQMEAKIKTVLDEYKSHLEHKSNGNTGNDWTDYPSVVRGGLITNASRADIACINQTTNIFFVGELKNKKNYTLEDAVRECAAYMYHVLWWFRVIQGRDIRQVYGFCACGPMCSKMKNQVTFSFMRLEIPTKIGGRFNLSRRHETQELNSTEMKSTMGRLADFLSHSHPHSDPVAATRLPFKDVPGSMMLPSSFSPGKNGLNLVQSGTAALVLKVKCDALFQKGRDLKNFLEEIFEIDGLLAGALAKRLTNKFKGDEYIYLKMINAAAGMYWKEKGAFRGRILISINDGDGLDAYDAESFFDATSCIMIIMHDMGAPISQVQLGFKQFCHEYLAMAQKVETICTYRQVVHGDIHRSNISYNVNGSEGNKLCVIDWDESTLEFPLKRNVNGDLKERYPACFLKNGLAFTRVQLFVLCRDFIKTHYSKTVSRKGNDGITFTDDGDTGVSLRGIEDSSDVEKEWTALKNALRLVA